LNRHRLEGMQQGQSNHRWYTCLWLMSRGAARIDMNDRYLWLAATLARAVTVRVMVNARSTHKSQQLVRVLVFLDYYFLGYHLKTRSAICCDPSSSNRLANLHTARCRPLWMVRLKNFETKMSLGRLSPN
jgi:hypothetical protein